MSAAPKARQWQRLRWLMLEAVYHNHRSQGHRFDMLDLLSVLQTYNSQLGTNQVITLLQELGPKGSEFIRYEKKTDAKSGETFLYQVEITPKGRQYFEGRQDDPRLHYVE